jgi:DNA-binding NtrC family response regulator
VLDVDDFSGVAPGRAKPPVEFDKSLSLKEVEKQHIAAVLQEHDFSINKAADVLGIHRNTLRQKMKDYGIEKG